MVNQHDSVDLEPKLEDILSVWGLEVTKKNIEKFMCPRGLLARKRRGLVAGSSQESCLWFLEENICGSKEDFLVTDKELEAM